MNIDITNIPIITSHDVYYDVYYNRGLRFECHSNSSISTTYRLLSISNGKPTGIIFINDLKHEWYNIICQDNLKLFAKYMRFKKDEPKLSSFSVISEFITGRLFDETYCKKPEPEIKTESDKLNNI